MTIQQIELHHFRSYSERRFELSPNVTMIIGKNGAGKTNLLEAIYTLYGGKSFRDSDEELLQFGENWWKITGKLGDTNRELRYQATQPSPKQLYIDGTSKGRFTYRHQLPMVLFEPDDLLMIHASPAKRRLYIDTLLVKLQPVYRQIIAKYDRALMQRNNLLKKPLSDHELSDALFAWDITLSTLGSQIMGARHTLLTELDEILTGYYQGITRQHETITVLYQTQHVRESNELARLLAQRLPQDRLRGFTTVGPHRDDIEFLMGGKSMKTTASRGEVRTLLLALKFAELSLIEQHTGESPLFLLDDVFSELDESRQQALTRFMGSVQKIITSTAIYPTKSSRDHRVITL